MAFDQRVGVDDMLIGDFLVEIDGISKTSFRKCTGGKKAFGEVESRDGDDPQRVRKQDGIMKVENVTLTEGRTTAASELEAWFEARGRKAISIVQLDHNGTEVHRWNCFECRCISLEIFNGDGVADEAAVNVIEISMEDWKKA